MAFSFDDAWDNGPEVTRAGTAAFGLYCRCGAWSARNLTDGFIPSEIAAGYGTPEWARKLVDAGLWETVEGGYRDPHYLHRNESRDQVMRRRQADAERKKRWRDQQKRKEKKSRRDSARSHNGSHGRNPSSLYHPLKGVKGAPAPDGAGGAPTESTPVEELRHPYADDGNDSCATCGLPATNRRHVTEDTA